jgi:hypothetical protein
MKVAIVGAASEACAWHWPCIKGIACEVFEAVPEVREIGAGITLLPHAMRELSDLGLQPQLEALAIENLESVFFNRYGQFVYREPRGRHAGYRLPELGIHRGRLHRVLFEAAVQRLARVVHTGHRCVRVDQSAHGAPCISRRMPRAMCRRRPRSSWPASVNSAVRRQFYPQEELAFGGINTWRGVSRFKPILTGKSYLRIGSVDTGKMVIYPIEDNVWPGHAAHRLGGRDPRPADAHERLEPRGAWRMCWRFSAAGPSTGWMCWPDPLCRDHLRVPHGGQGPRGTVELRPRDPAGRCRPPHVSARLQRLGPGHARCARAGRPLAADPQRRPAGAAAAYGPAACPPPARWC